MNYQQHLALAMVHLGDNDETAVQAELDAALAEAGRIDPDGPRVAECYNYVAQFHTQAGRDAQARAALEKVVAIYERFPEFAEGLADYYLQLMGLCSGLGDSAGADVWRQKAKAAPAQDKPWR